MAQARWAALRSLYEGAPATPELLAAVAERSARIIRVRAAREGWAAPRGKAGRASRGRRLDAAVDGLIAQVEAIGQNGEDGLAGLDKQRIDAVLSLARTLEKLGEMAAGEPAAEENQARTDAELASTLWRIDERIVELARAHAGRLGAGEPEG